MGNVRLLHKRGLPGEFQIHQRRYGRPALGLRFQCQPHERFVLAQLFLIRSTPRQ